MLDHDSGYLAEKNENPEYRNENARTKIQKRMQELKCRK
jgi:hypothetical protein